MSPKSDRQKAASPRSDAPNVPPGKQSQPDPRRPNVDVEPPATAQERSADRPPAEQWREHEHQSPATDLRAKQLLEETGSPELAKRAVEQADVPADAPVLPPDAADQDAAAREFGYESFAALVKDAVSFPVDRGRGLMVCELKDGRWIRFDQESWPRHEIFRSREEAMKPVASG
jgi:hypothetical protein